MEALKTLDYYEVFPRTPSSAKPFILLDGHSSRLEMPFLDYINNPKDNWVVCIGVPLWNRPMAGRDFKEQNGSFNIAMTKAKENLLKLK